MLNKNILEKLYLKYNQRKFVYPDPVGFLYAYDDVCDREIVGLVASALAYGRVAQIHKSIASILEKIKPSPCAFLKDVSKDHLFNSFDGFKHRFTTAKELSLMLWAIKLLLEKYGSLQECFIKGLNPDDDTVFSAISYFTSELLAESNLDHSSLIPIPQKGSACKRLSLFLRWMVRKDNIDPGGWDKVDTSKLIMPIDVHIYKFSLALGLTKRKNADMRTAQEITAAFKKISPEDPVKYDFALNRSSILGDDDLKLLFDKEKGPVHNI